MQKCITQRIQLSVLKIQKLSTKNSKYNFTGQDVASNFNLMIKKTMLHSYALTPFMRQIKF